MALQQECLALRHELHDRHGIAVAMYDLGKVLADRGDHAAARALVEESLERWRALGDTWGMAAALNHLGEQAREQGDLAVAERLYEQSLPLFEAVGDRRGTSIVTHNLAIVASEQGDPRRALTLHRACLPLKRELGDREGLVCSLVNLANLVQSQGFHERAARLSGAAEAHREAIGAGLPPYERAIQARTIALARTELGEARFDAAWAEGRTTTIEKAFADAFLDTDAATEAASVPPGAPLSRREREVATLIAQGRTNRQIAEVLVIAERTAGRHVENILAKLGLDSRTQVATWAVEHGLLPRSPH